MKTIALRGLVLAGLLHWNASAADYTLAVNYGTELGAVSPQIIGFNTNYSIEPDVQWQGGAGNLPTLLSPLSTKILRFPGGTVVTFYHWTYPTGQGQVDSWDPAFNPALNKPASETMSLDDYLDVVIAKGITPLVGVNMGSGKRFNRVQDGIDEAKALVQHCLDRGANVKYYYLDNEPYASDANYTYTAQEYGAQVNLYAPAMRLIDPTIKIIANLTPSPTDTVYTQTVVQQAGANIDYVDLHFYWRFQSATFANWTSEPHMLNQGSTPYSQQRAIYRQMFADAGFPNIELAAMEWNAGPFGTGNPEPTEAQYALMESEQFIQLIQSGLPLACFWPQHSTSGDQKRALISSAQNYTPNKVYDMFQQFATIGSRVQLTNTLGGSAALDRLTNLSVKTTDLKTLNVYLVNKVQTQASVVVDLDLSSFSNFNAQSAVGFESTDTSVGPLNIHSISVTKTGTHVSLTMLKNSFAKVTISRPAQPVTLTFAPTQDAMVKEFAPTTNFGTLTQMQANGSTTGFAKQMFVKFNVTGIPAGATVTSATLLIDSQTTGTGRPVTAHASGNPSWTETGITWNNKPALGAVLSTVSSHTSGADSQWSVTSAISGNGNATFGLDSSYVGDTSFSARENGPSTAPSLVVVYLP